ncbi:MAG TPA: hypothetical protein VF821_18410 [Lentzea sp.]
MKDLVNRNYDPNAATTVIDAWAQFGTKFRELGNDFSKIVNDSHAGWDGKAAEAVRLALTKVGQFADNSGFHRRLQDRRAHDRPEPLLLRKISFGPAAPMRNLYDAAADEVKTRAQ